MSSQRYVPPPDQRYPPPDDSRFNSRDRSPARYGGDRFPSGGSSYRGGYQTRPESARDSTAASLNRDVPRGPRASFDAPRGRGAFSASAPRGRGFSSRGDYRGGSFRGGDIARPSRDSDSWPDDPDRSWRADRNFDTRERRPSPPSARPRQPEFRDFRDAPASAPQRPEGDFTRPRGPSREPSHTSPVTSDSRRESFSHAGRTYVGAGRGRAEWDPRARERDRDRFNEDRPFRTRSRSPFRDSRRDLDSRDDRRFDGRDRSPDRDRDDRDRLFDRYGRHRSPVSNEALRHSPPSTASSASRPVSPGGNARPLVESDGLGLRRVSSVNQPGERRQSLRHGSFPPKPLSTKDAQDSRASSPPQAPEVPAFGSLPFGLTPGWNVWKNPGDAKPAQQQTTPSAPVPPAPKSTASSASTSKPATDFQPPTAPKADRIFESTSTSTDKAAGPRLDSRDGNIITPTSPTIPQSPAAISQAASVRGTGLTPSLKGSPPVSPTLLVPTGPKTSPNFPSAPRLGANVPTGPKADRLPPGTPTGPASSSQWQWQRSAVPSTKTSPLIPAKRDFVGDDRGRDPSEAGIKRSMRSAQGLNLESNQQHYDQDIPKKESVSQDMPLRSPVVGSSNSNENYADVAPDGAHASINGRVDDFDRDDPMELDEDDFQKKEYRFQREKARLESELIDLSSRHLRGSTPLEQLALLQSVALIDLPSSDLLQPSGKNDTILGTGHLLTPKAEAVERESFSPIEELAQSEPPPVESPELRALPFLHQGPPTPIEELDLYKKNIDEYNVAKGKVADMLGRYVDGKVHQEAHLREQYRQVYMPWIVSVEQMDAETKDDSPLEEESDATATMPALEPSVSISTPVPAEGRRRGQNTEYDLERVIQESLETANREQARRIKQEQSAKFDPDKETEGWALEEDSDRDRHYFVDKTSEITTAQVVSCWNFRPPVDNFTETDHEILVQKFWEYPKKWGKLAQELNNRYTFKECINHYYATKWNKEFKEKRDKRRQKGQRGRLRGGQHMSGRPKANALISNLGDVRAELYEGDEFNHGNIAMTDRGRPRRAAAPTFGEKESEDQAQSTITPGRRGLKQHDNQDENPEKPGRRSRNTGKEKPVRKSRGQPSSRARSLSLDKRDNSLTRKVHDSNTPEAFGRENEMNGHLVHGQALGQPSHLPATSALATDSLPTGTPPSQTQRTGPTSYWSVQEVSAFPSYLARYGTNWAAISSLMGTKTATMVKNYYHRLLNQNNGAAQKELEEMVNQADLKQGKDKEQDRGGKAMGTGSTKREGQSEPHAIQHVHNPAPVEQNSLRSSEKIDQAIRADPRAQHMPYISRPGETTSTNLVNRESEQHLIPSRGNDPPIRQPPPISPQQPHGNQYSSREMFDYDGQSRPLAPSVQQSLQNRPPTDASLQGYHSSLGPAPARQFGGSPPQSYSRLPQATTSSSRSILNDGRVVEDRPYQPHIDQPSRSGPASSGPSVSQSNPNAGWLSGVRSSSPIREPPRLPNQAPPSANQPQPNATRAEPRKVSSLAAILNADDNEPRRPSASSSNIQRTATPPMGQQYSSRPPLQSERHQGFSDSAGLTRPVPSFSRQGSLNSPPPPIPRSGAPDQPQLSQTMPRQNWQSPPTYTSMLNPQGLGHPRTSQTQERPPARSPPPSLDYHRQSLQSFGNRHPASPPPTSLGFSHPSQHMSQQQSYRQPLQDSHQRPMSPPHADRSLGPAYSPPMRSHRHPGNQDPNQTSQQPPRYQQGHSSFGTSSSSPHRRDSSESAIPGGRTATNESGPRYGPGYQHHAEERHSQHDRDSRANLRPDWFLMHGSGNYRSGPSGSSHHPFRHQRHHTDAERRGSDQGSGGNAR